ncbi:MAG: menaquinone biosynthesis protein [Thermoanaerobaculia bacterium]|nr:menaquinone biosynthesis protein [Thermoanaerobaculia bacterium]
MPLRLGIVDYLNSKPLAWSFLDGRTVEGWQALFLPPAGVAAELAAGGLDVGLVPSIELARIPGLEIVSDACVASEREVRSVLLVSRRPLARIGSIALDENSRTSAALVRILCAERWGIEPGFHEARPAVEEMLEGSDAALVIGDPALHVDPRRYLTFDLAREWYDLTGLPFVFAVWAARPGTSTAELVRVLDESLGRGLRRLEALAAAAAAELGLPLEAMRRYLTRNLHYRLGPEERRGLAEFLRRARAHGLAPHSRGAEAGESPR